MSNPAVNHEITDNQVLTAWQKYRLRLHRRQLLWRSFRSRHQLKTVSAKDISPGGPLLFAVVRNEETRLPFFLKHYRELGVAHFFVVDNFSSDGSRSLLSEQNDCSIWQTDAGYRDARFGVDWLTWLQMRYGHDRWCLMADADELLVYHGDDQFKLPELTEQLDAMGRSAFGAMTIDLYPPSELGTQNYRADDDPRELLTHFDPGPYRAVRQSPKGNLWVQGGVRERVFFPQHPEQSPTLNKLPLIKWHRSYAWVNSSHSLLPRALNFQYDGPGGTQPSGALLHTKFLPEIVSKSETERQRQQHYHDPERFDHYYQTIEQGPVLWNENSVKYEGPSQLVDLGLMAPKSAWL